MGTLQRRQWHPTPVLLLAWKIPWMEEPGGLQSMGSLRVGHDWATSFSLFTFINWRRKWQPTPVFLPGESQGRGAWWAAIYGFTQSWTRLKWFSSSSMGTLNTTLVYCCSVAQSWPTLCDPMDYYRSLGSFLWGISQARMLDFLAIPFSRVSSLLRDGTRVSCIGRQILYHLATIEALPYFVIIEIKLNSVSIYWKQWCNIFFLSNFTGHLVWFRFFCFVYFSLCVKGTFSWLWSSLE